MNHKTKKTIYNAVVGLLLGVGLVWVGLKFIRLGTVAYTDNAQVKQLILPVHARVGGYIKEVRFDEYQSVKKGDTLLILEDIEYRHRVALAEADCQNARAGKTVIASTVQTVANAIEVSDAVLAESLALVRHAEQEEKRYKNLLDQESVTGQEYEGVKTKYIALKAKYESLKRQKQTSILATHEQSTRLTQNDALIQVAETALQLAKLNLSYTVVVAPTDGYTGRKNIQVGQLLQPGQPVVDLIDNQEKWVIANFKETQALLLQEGQEVSLSVDAFQQQPFTGRITSIANATGASFSLIPQDNSAGNFVKIEQRVPVRIAFSEDIDPAVWAQIRAGMNVECTVND